MFMSRRDAFHSGGGKRLAAGAALRKKRAGGQVDPASVLFWGIHPVLEILQSRPRQLKTIYLAKQPSTARAREIISLAERRHIPVRMDAAAFAEVLRRKDMAPSAHQGVLAVGEPFATVSLSSFLDKIRDRAGPSALPVIVALDNMQDPQNVGAVLRSSLAAGVAGIVVAKDRAAPLGGTVAKASAGAAAHLDICQVTNLPVALRQIKEAGFWIFGTVKDGAKSLYSMDFSVSVCLVLGSEEKGVRPLVRKQCDLLISIPMQGGLDSLNVSTAAAIVLFEIVRQRQQVLSGNSAVTPTAAGNEQDTVQQRSEE
jgi:23S rRNA (guanosine2251-2'-O)-methyltransferase